MPNSRTVLLLRRLSTSDIKLKNLAINQPVSKERLRSNSFDGVRDTNISKRFSSYNSTLKRNHSDNIIKMSTLPSNDKHTNSLLKEKSPYLLQHAHNPVLWYPWGEEAIDKAKRENKLIFLSVGYSTCHWCHVMEKESFENEEIAQLMNDNYINIKVDREERPDIDRVYMLFVLATNGSGGWPMSVFLTPDLQPVAGGTYFPPEDRWGRPGFKSILRSLAEKWKSNPQSFLEAANSTMNALKKMTKLNLDNSSVPNEKAWNKCVKTYIKLFEPDFGGFGTAPKFPQASIFSFLFHYYARDKNNPEGKKCLEMCLHTLTKIAKGGINDHLGGGFARYSVDNDWHVPHFEKMLYDQSQLIIAYTDAYLASKDDFFADVIRDTIRYVNRNLRHELGGYYSAEDADSYPNSESMHKKEGAYYVWEYEEIKRLLDGKTRAGHSYLEIFCDYFNVEEEGNISPESDPHEELTNKNVLIVYGSKEESAEKHGLTIKEFDEIIKECKDLLYKARLERPRPHLDSKMLCSWNGLMISGLAQAGQGLGEKDYVDDAIKTANFIKQHLYDPNTKTLYHSCYRNENGSITQTQTPIKGFLDDYAFLIKGLLDLYEASLDYQWLNWARDLQTKQNELFWDPIDKGYFTCSAEDKSVVLRLKEDQDGAEPSGNSISCHNLLRLATYSDKEAASEADSTEREMAKDILTAFSKRLENTPTALPQMMSAVMFYNDSPTQVVIAGSSSDPRTLALVRAVRSRLLAARVLCVADPAARDAPSRVKDILLSRGRCVEDAPAAFVCRRFACSLPVTDGERLGALLDESPATSAS